MPRSHNCRGANCHCRPSGKQERFLQPSLLLCLAEHSSYGYELLERLSLFRFHTGGVDPGAVYRHLRRLESEGYVESRWETGEAGPAKRVYVITAAGQELLKAWVAELEGRRAALDDFLSRYQELSEKADA